ncbi:MAG TPA: hypothetical protein VK680_15740 [Solirubrobacteraceae bacterium]|jgi:hypothetical protein|nr:hypothetical protein [Solirubrobacteraceae bacterium]
MQINLSDDYFEARLAPWQKLIGLMGNVRVARADISDVRVVSDPIRDAMHSGIKVGLRVPWLCYIARTIRLDEAFIVRRGVPGLSFAVANNTLLRRVLVSTHQAGELASRLQDGSAEHHA